MACISFNATLTRQIKPYCVQYRYLTDQQDSRPSFDDFWDAIDEYDRTIAAETSREPIEKAFRMVELATQATRAQYPHLDVAFLENGRQMFTVN